MVEGGWKSSFVTLKNELRSDELTHTYTNPNDELHQ